MDTSTPRLQSGERDVRIGPHVTVSASMDRSHRIR